MSSIPILCSSVAPNYDESAVPGYVLPDPLICQDGLPVVDAKTWVTLRRRELIELFARHVYGSLPAPLEFRARELESGGAFNGLAIREQIRLDFVGRNSERAFLNLLIYRPRALETAALVFLGLNFRGNHSTTGDPTVALPESWISETFERGVAASRWPYEDLLAAGYAVATFYYGDAAPDSPQHWREGFSRLFFSGRTGSPLDEEPGAISWWAWAVSRVVDYLLTRNEFDSRRISVVGHSRQGKAALWASALDERIALAISNNSGCTGAALSRRCFGERGFHLNANFPHWCCGNYRKYDLRESELPIDQHELIALIAPRPVYVACATEDLWADPKGEFLAAKAASSVYRLFGCEGLSDMETPAPDLPVGDRVAYHLRTGKHEITRWDWQQFAAFADRLSR